MSLSLKPTHATVKAYYDTLHEFGQLYIDHEGAVRSAFQTLLAKCGQRTEPKLTLIPEYRIKRARGSTVILDGALVDLYKLPHGYWEAKDEKDDLAKEVERKLDKGYPSDNTIFQAPERAILYQRGTRIFDEDITRPEALVSVVNQFFEYKMPHIEEWERAVNEFSDRVPELSQQVESLIKEERRRNPSFRNVFDDFYALCRQAINPNLSEEAVERMLVQHLLTERIFRKIFNNPDFSHRNAVAAEIEKVITELTKRSLNRDDFLKKLEPFYHAIERNAENATDYTAKQDFLNTVYMRFFQGYSPKEADTHGIVYTPQPIVNFMVRSVEEILQKEFDRSLSDKGVHILDPFVGTGNFITRIMQEIKTTDLPYKYEHELHCNEVMLLPYYIASMNIEHAYYERVAEYKPFPGICLVDTFELAEAEQASLGFMNEENAQRVKRQKDSPIFVILGNPPYNAGQVDETDNNKNRKYTVIDKRVSETFGRGSSATLLRKLQDPYIKAIRWATDRIGFEGIVCFVTNSSFIDDRSLDGVRDALGWYYDQLYVLDLGGNVRKNPKLSGTTHNVFGIQVGVSISIFVRKTGGEKDVCCPIRYASVDQFWRKEEKYSFLEASGAIGGIQWQLLAPDKNHTWLTSNLRSEFEDFVQITRLFREHALGISTNRDSVVYGFDERQVAVNVKEFISQYLAQLDAYHRGDKPKNLDAFVDHGALKWSRNLKRHFVSGDAPTFSNTNLKRVLYRPFTVASLYHADVLVDEPARTAQYATVQGHDNSLICLTAPGSDKPFMTTAAAMPVDLHLVGAGCGTQCFPFYTYAEDGTHRRENITDWALDQFRSHYADPSITKWDIFHYVYTILHHPDYRQRYAANLRRELPRIPFASAVPSACHPEPPSFGAEGSMHPAGSTDAANESIDPSARKKSEPLDDNQKPPVSSVPSVVKDVDVFRAFVKAGQRLAEIHVHYEQQPEYPLEKIEKKGEQLDYRVTKMKLSKDKTQLIYNQFLTLDGIPPETYEYRLGNRSALEWIVDQYQVSTDKRSGITNDPNREDDPQYILRLIGQVISVSLETVKILGSLPALTT